MPIYEYACRQCHHAFEALVRADSTPTCPQCQSADLEKQLSVFATSTVADRAPAMASPCGSCGHPDGPGACGVH